MPRDGILFGYGIQLGQHFCGNLQARRLQSSFHRIVAEEGFTTTAGAIGVLATGSLNAATIASLLRQLPRGTWELVTHPGYNDADLADVHTRLRASRDTERLALEQLRQFPEIELVSF